VLFSQTGRFRAPGRSDTTSFALDPDGRIVQAHVGRYPSLVHDLEVRVLAGLPVDAIVERVDDEGQVRPGDHADLSDVPGVDLSGLAAAARRRQT
jgi:hypothetical protein